MKASKIALSLVAASCLATALNAADSLAEALSNGKFSAGRCKSHIRYAKG